MVKSIFVLAMVAFSTLIGEIQVGESCFVNPEFEYALKVVRLELMLPETIDYQMRIDEDTGLMYAFFSAETAYEGKEIFMQKMIGHSLYRNDSILEEEQKEDGIFFTLSMKNFYKNMGQELPFSMQSVRMWHKDGILSLVCVLTSEETKEHSDEVLKTFEVR